MGLQKVKPSAYEQNPDSDPEFNAGTFVYEKKTKKLPIGGQHTIPSPIFPRLDRNSRRREGVTQSDVGLSRTSLQRPRQRNVTDTNPLLEYFGDNLDLHSASEDDEVTDDHLDDGSDKDILAPDEPIVSKTLMPFVINQTEEAISTRPSSAVDNSETESESDAEPTAGPKKRKSPLSPQGLPPAKRARTPQGQDDSETESESEAEPVLVPPAKDGEGFPLAPGQLPLGPLMLDRAQGIMVPAAINTYLREYQRDGVRFFWGLCDQGKGGLLGDDMGLVRKTIQVISFLSAIMKKYGDVRDVDRRRKHVSQLQDRPEWADRRTLPPANATWPTCLIIAPSSVVPNWEREFQTWGYFEVGVYTGSQREDVLTDFRMGRLDIMITSFDLARRDITLLEDLAWSTIIVDEVHRVKNPRSKITEAYNRFACIRRFGLTGTAIQNSYSELWTILDWMNPGKLGTSKQWKGYVVRPLTIGQSIKATEEERSKALAVAMILPTKIDEVVFCPLTPTQTKVYKRILSIASVQNLLHKDEQCECGSRKKRKDCCHPFEKGDVLKHMSILIKISNHLGLILPAPSDTPEQTARHREIAEYVFAGEPVPKYGTAIMQPQYCGKWAVLDMLLRDWRKDRSNKVLLFTKSVKLLEMLEFHLGKNGYGFLKLDGSTKQSDRMPMIDEFHKNPDVFVFLISTLAGGTGLNLTGANKVVIFDPAHDLQAMDRAYRFGQSRDVSVYRLLGAGSIEELIYARQVYKQQQMAIGYQASVQTSFHEDTLATKVAIERASIVELDWALAHLHGKSRRRSRSKADDWVHEADVKGGKEEADLRGLSSLLFDDEPPDLVEENDVQKTLSAIGVRYSHRNDDILQPSRIEEERSRDALRRHKERKAAVRKRKQAGESEPASRSKTPEEQWPPKRKHHKAPASPQKLLVSRQRALIELGMIQSPAHLPTFAQSFKGLIARLDEHARGHS
ncbi:RAD26-like SNF2 family DNA-dependent ATPase [Pisolithus sp. B1]|nr:RAD26-like SNF2 family DNA-dependent ATPase [Pisolithus sp. B1]